MNAEQFLTPPISLARDIDNGDERTACTVLVLGDRRAHVMRQSPAFIQAHLAGTCTREAVLHIGYHRDEACSLASQWSVGDAHASQAAPVRCRAGQCVE